MYDVAHQQMGFEVTEGPGGFRLSPIIRRGELDAYDGRLYDDNLIKEIQAK